MNGDAAGEVAEYEPSPIELRWWLVRHWWRRLPERIAWAVAWRLPRRIVNLCVIRVWSAATTGPFGNETPTGVTVDVALQRWEKGHGR